MKNILLFLSGKYKRSLLLKAEKVVWDIYKNLGLTSTGWAAREAIRKLK
jgi:hypothetical protein